MARTPQLVSDRKKALLDHIVRQYVATAAPVGSVSLARQHGLDVSPATIRNDMAELEAEGYITRPHTSAGAVPVDKAYRFFVEHLATTPQPPARTRVQVQRRFHEVEGDLEMWARLAVTLLSQMVHNVAIASPPHAQQTRLKRLELVHLEQLSFLLILVLPQAQVRQQLLAAPRPVTQDELITVANKLNSSIAGKSRPQIAFQRVEPSSLEDLVLQETVSLLEAADREAYENHYMEGLRHMLGQPEFAVAARARQAVEVLEDHKVVHELLAQGPEQGTVRVVIGAENRRHSLHPFSVVVCRYGVPGEATGTVSVIGPTRMDYASVMAGVQYIAHIMTGLMDLLHKRP